MRNDQSEYKLSTLQDIENIKDEVSQRFKDELAHKNSEMSKLEHMYTERIDMLQREVSKLHVQLDQQIAIERELREGNEHLRVRADELNLIVHKGQETERRELIELQIQLSQLTQEKTIKEECHSKQVLDLKHRLQDELLEKERLQIENKAMLERHNHEQQLLKERQTLDLERQKALTEKQIQLLTDKAREAQDEVEHIRSRCEKLESQL